MRCCGGFSSADSGRLSGLDPYWLADTGGVAHFDGSFEDHHRGIAVFLDLDPVLGAAYGEHRRRGGDQTFAVVTLGCRFENSAQSTSFDLEQYPRTVVREAKGRLPLARPS